MESFMTIEWDRNCGVDPMDVLSLLDKIQVYLKKKKYGSSVSKICVIMTCMAREFKQRKKYKKDIGRFEYDILLDYFLIKNVELEEKKKLILYQMIKVTEETFSKYKFEEFDKASFLSDFKQIVNSVEW